jgi:hypothetical protein
VHPFADAAVLLELLFQVPDHLVQQMSGLLNQHDHLVADDFRRATCEDRLPLLPVGMLNRERARILLALVCHGPLGEVMGFVWYGRFLP